MKPYNPLEKENLGKSVADSLILQLPVPLGKITPFEGAGIYAIYYQGDYEDYRGLKKWNCEGAEFSIPIYVGKAIPEGGRKGTGEVRKKRPRPPLYTRLSEHRKTLEGTGNLDINDFWCRYLLVDDIWIPLGESLMIRRYRPVWNTLVDGFGNHPPGKGREKGARPIWDTLHPGRRWAEILPPSNLSVEQIKHHIAQYLEAYETFQTTNPAPDNL